MEHPTKIIRTQLGREHGMWPLLRRYFRRGLSGPDWLWEPISAAPVIRNIINRLFINIITNAIPARPHPWSLWSPTETQPIAPYTSWTGLTDRSYTGRHLPPAEDAWIKTLPDLDRLRPLFLRQRFDPCPRSSALFCFFAQWFTDSFLRTHPSDIRKNTSNHEIDLCQIYGLCAEDTRLLRSLSGGRLKSQILLQQEYPAFLFEEDGLQVREEFLKLSYIDAQKKDYDKPITPDAFNQASRKKAFFATGLERGNSTIAYSALNTIFLREHNRLCARIQEQHPDWDDDRLFETARNANIAQLLKIIVEDYINHLSSAAFKLFLEVGFAERQKWYRTNRICAEFNLLYRWHALVPNTCSINGRDIKNEAFRFNNQLLMEEGIESVIGSASHQKAGQIKLANTPFFLVEAELAALDKARTWRVQSYNAYCLHFGLSPAKSFEDLTGDAALTNTLKSLYRTIDDVELTVGLLAQERDPNAVFGELMSFMVGADAFSQALTNPLLAQEVFNEATFSEAGLASVLQTSTLDQLVQRHTQMNGRRASFGVQSAAAATTHPNHALTPIPGPQKWTLLNTVIDTLDFFVFSGWTNFFTRRRDRYKSPVFRANLFKPTIVLLDQQAIQPLFNATQFRQDYGFSWAVPPRPLVGNVVPSIFKSGPEHDRPKQLYINMLRKRSDTLLDVFFATANRFESRWLEKQTFSFKAQLEIFSAEFLFDWYFGIRPDASKTIFLYSGIFSHLIPGLTKYAPWSAYSKSLLIYHDLLSKVTASPGFEDLKPLAHAIGMHDDEITAKQLLFVAGMNSFLGTQNLYKSVIGELSQRPDLCDQLREEIIRGTGGIEPNTLSQLSPQAMPLLDKVIREILRMHPPVSFIFGRANEDGVISTQDGRQFEFRKDELLMGVLPVAMHDTLVFDKPHEFTPARHDGAHPGKGLIWPRGHHDEAASAADRTCPGKDISVLLAKLLCIWLLPRCRWTLASPATWDKNRFDLNVAAPVGPMTVSDFTAATTHS